jgi:predicted kinase
MKSLTAALLLSGLMVSGAAALADESATAPSMVDAHATHKKLMKECIDKEKSQNDTAASDDAKKQCQARVKTQMQQMKNAGTMPTSSDTPTPVANPQ